MENEKLSGSFAQKYDPMSDSFVVVEKMNTEENKNKRFEPFSFFKFRKNRIMESEQDRPEQQPAQPVKPVQPVPDISTPPSSSQPTNPITTNPARPSNPQPMPPANASVVLARNAYNKLITLNALYQSLAINNPENADLFNDLASETAILQATMLSIYQNLTGNNFIPAQNQTAPVLSGNLCKDLIITQNLLQNIIDTVISLQRSVNVQSIDRQLAIITATLFSQKNKLSSLQTSCK